MYALSTIMFVTVLVTFDPDQLCHLPKKKRPVVKNKAFRKSIKNLEDFSSNVWYLLTIWLCSIIIGGFYLCERKRCYQSSQGQVIVYNWGDYIDPDVTDHV